MPETRNPPASVECWPANVVEVECRSCFACCADLDRAGMIATGRVVLYVTRQADLSPSYRYTVGNWPGSLRFDVRASSTGRHNIAGTRLDVWFRGPDGHVWHGVQYGDNTQLTHCRRTRERCAPAEG